MLVTRWSEWDGQKMRQAIFAGDMPEYAALLLPDGTERSHNSVYHLESLLEHVTWVVDEAKKLTELLVDPQDKISLIVAATWHDVGKPFCMLEKTRYICDACGRSHHEDQPRCKMSDCNGKLTPITVTGYGGHDKAGASPWIFGNIARRENLSVVTSQVVRELIAGHDKVHTLSTENRLGNVSLLALMLNLADNRGRIPSPCYEAEKDQQEATVWAEIERRLKC